MFSVKSETSHASNFGQTPGPHSEKWPLSFPFYLPRSASKLGYNNKFIGPRISVASATEALGSGRISFHVEYALVDSEDPGPSRPARRADRSRMANAIAQDLLNSDSETAPNEKKCKRKSGMKSKKNRDNSDPEDQDFTSGASGDDSDSDIEMIIPMKTWRIPYLGRLFRKTPNARWLPNPQPPGSEGGTADTGSEELGNAEAGPSRQPEPELKPKQQTDATGASVEGSHYYKFFFGNGARSLACGVSPVTAKIAAEYVAEVKDINQNIKAMFEKQAEDARPFTAVITDEFREMLEYTHHHSPKPLNIPSDESVKKRITRMSQDGRWFEANFQRKTIDFAEMKKQGGWDIVYGMDCGAEDDSPANRNDSMIHSMKSAFMLLRSVVKWEKGQTVANSEVRKYSASGLTVYISVSDLKTGYEQTNR
ncbi:hypothetical protein B0H14DRAFT_2632235 [Mycena olivaceomarginata]|nr:hypothetical protein B0H14DRAFT_2632235 [Mycena olivaceomarginata]